MTEPEQQAAPEIPEVPVKLLDREIFVRMPRPEQILVWQRTLDNLTKAPANEQWDSQQVMASLERLRKIVDSIIVNKADVTWLDDQFLEGTLDFAGLTPFITDVVNTFADLAEAESPNRETKRAVKKTARKKARA